MRHGAIPDLELQVPEPPKPPLHPPKPPLDPTFPPKEPPRPPGEPPPSRYRVCSAVL